MCVLTSLVAQRSESVVVGVEDAIAVARGATLLRSVITLGVLVILVGGTELDVLLTKTR